MKAKLMNGTYYEIGGGFSDDKVINIANTSMTDVDAKEEAINTENWAYKNTYVDGKRTESIKLWDPYGDAYFMVGREDEYYEPLPYEMRHRYQMLGRLKADCDYFLGNGTGYEGHLWAGSVEEQIAEMRKRWNEFAEDEKPEWLTMEQIDEYEKNMLNVREQVRKIKESMKPGSIYTLEIVKNVVNVTSCIEH